MTLETTRLLLRPIISSDAHDIFEYSCEPNVGPNAGWKPHENIQETHEIMKEVFLDKDSVFGIVLKETDKMIGSIGIVDDPKRQNTAAGMLGYAMSEKHWNKGLMTEAAMEVIRFGFTDLKLELISLYCYPDNPASRRIAEKCGFVYEGTLAKCEELYNGMVKDNLCYALLRPVGPTV